ncbi:MAG TPA: prepilin-type N-terminal cleavage/methylation domain-containing protein [Chthonomonadaceae bacterium]|nr:prepilin-type N-terminal cleavage/methylation domain-containing protein [Chthonomonadaceae bacterium]
MFRMTTLRRGFSLIEILVVCVIIAALSAGIYAFYLGHGSGKPGEKQRSVMQRGHDPECINNLQQLRAALQMAQSSEENGKFPATLKELPGIPESMLSCPDGHVPYQYDPSTGQVHCTQPGHENF